ncbi:MAG: hypothetical protein RL274_1698 [Pseudomonadota bacterium]
MAVGMKVTRYEIDRQGKISVFAENDDALKMPTDAEEVGTAKRIVL